MDENNSLFSRFKSVVNRVFEFFLKYPLAVVITLFVVVGGAILTVFGSKIQIGGLLGKLWGHDPETDGDILNKPRLDENGKPIPLGEPDKDGFIQPVVLEIKDPGLLSNPNKIVVVDSDGKELTLQLPDGVKNKDVKEVVSIDSNVYQISNNDSGVDAGKLLNEISK